MVSRRDFVRIVPALGAFTIAANHAHAQAPEVPAWPSAPPAEGSYRDEEPRDVH